MWARPHLRDAHASEDPTGRPEGWQLVRNTPEEQSIMIDNLCFGIDGRHVLGRRIRDGACGSAPLYIRARPLEEARDPGGLDEAVPPTRGRGEYEGIDGTTRCRRCGV